MSGIGGSGRPLAAQNILRSLRPPLSFATLSRLPFAVPNEYHRFPTSDGVNVSAPPPPGALDLFSLLGSAYSVWTADKKPYVGGWHQKAAGR
jgi:hypothetical protein